MSSSRICELVRVFLFIINTFSLIEQEKAARTIENGEMSAVFHKQTKYDGLSKWSD